MAVQQVATGVWRIPLGGVNAFLIEADDGLVLVDAGFARSPAKITEAIYELGRRPEDVHAILATHLHRDHTGGLAEMKRRTGAEVWMHPYDAALVRQGVRGRPYGIGPSAIRGATQWVMGVLPERHAEPVAVEHEVSDGEELPFAGLRAVYAPGHTLGHTAFWLPRDGGVLFVGDAAANVLRLGMSPIYEDWDEGGRTLARLATLDFEVACFAHGRPIRARASARFRARFAAAEAADETGAPDTATAPDASEETGAPDTATAPDAPPEQS